MAKPGAVILPRRTAAPISAFHIAVKRGITFQKAWDQFRLPLPFSRAIMFFAPPVRVPPDADNDTVKQKQAELQSALEDVRDAAESWFTLTERGRDYLRDELRQTDEEDEVYSADEMDEA